MFKKPNLTAVELFLCPSCENWTVGEEEKREEEKAGQKNRSAAQQQRRQRQRRSLGTQWMRKKALMKQEKMLKMAIRVRKRALDSARWLLEGTTMSYDEEGPLRGQHVDDGEHEPRCEEKKYFWFTNLYWETKWTVQWLL